MWTLGGVQIAVQDEGGANSNTVARLQPLSGGTIKQNFGYESEVIKIAGMIVGDTDKAALKGFSQSSTTRALIDPSGNNLGSFTVKNFNWKRINSVCQTIRGDLASTAPVYQVDMDLYE